MLKVIQQTRLPTRRLECHWSHASQWLCPIRRDKEKQDYQTDLFGRAPQRQLFQSGSPKRFESRMSFLFMGQILVAAAIRAIFESVSKSNSFGKPPQVCCIAADETGQFSVVGESGPHGWIPRRQSDLLRGTDPLGNVPH